MRRLSPALLVLLVLTSGCGGSSTPSVAKAPTVDAAVLTSSGAKTAAAGTSRMSLTSESTTNGQHVLISGDGAFAFSGGEGDMKLTIGGLPGGQDLTMRELITGGNLYLSITGQPGYYRLKVADLLGTSLGQGTNPASGLAVLAGISGPISTVGTEDVRGAKTTHVRGTIDGAKAQASVGGAMKAYLKGILGSATPGPIPFEAWVDGEGRMRKLVQNVTLTVKGVKVVSKTTTEYYDFGTKVAVKAPPASEVKDGAPILAALKAQAGG
ncbi:MAG: lipoprotein [Frankiales bacterium]|nr:lipoprotein [Frankiales bacterium]